MFKRLSGQVLKSLTPKRPWPRSNKKKWPSGAKILYLVSGRDRAWKIWPVQTSTTGYMYPVIFFFSFWFSCIIYWLQLLRILYFEWFLHPELHVSSVVFFFFAVVVVFMHKLHWTFWNLIFWVILFSFTRARKAL